MYDGSVEKFFAAFLNSDSLSQEEINKLKEIVEQSK
jgi:predicted transcriptional regulator